MGQFSIAGQSVSRAFCCCLLVAITVVVCLRGQHAAGASCQPIPTNAVSWWPGDGSALDIIGGNGGTLVSNAVANGVGVVGEAFGFNGTTAYVQIPDSPSLRPTNLTVECWLKFNSLDSTGNAGVGQQYIVFKQNTRSGSFEGYALTKERNGGVDQLVFGVSSAAGLIAEARSSTVVVTGAWYHVAGVRGSNFIQIFINGQLQSQTAVNFPQDYGTLPLYFGSSGQGYWDRKFSGLLDEVTLYNRALSSNELSAVYLSGVAGKCKAVSIDSQPQSLSRLPGESASFSVIASGLAPIRYLWRLNNSPISGQTNALLSIASVSLSDQGNYSVVVSNVFGAVTSQVAVLSVGAPPVITQQPISRTNIAGTAASFTVNATGSPAPSYQWRFNGATIPGATGSAFSIGSVQVGDAGSYSAVISNVVGVVTSAVAILTIWVPPSIIQNPSPADVVEGQPASFSVAAVGTSPISYQWLFNGSPITGATASNFVLSSTLLSQGGEYAAVALNVAGLQTSAVAILTVRPAAPVIRTQPIGGSVVEGESWTFTVGVSGTPPLSYQWLFNGVSIPSATASAHTIPKVEPSQAGNYAVVVANSAGITNSLAASLGVVPLATVPDPCLSNAIRCALGMQSGGLTVPDMLSLTCLNAANCEMTNLSGIEQAVNLQSLQLSFNRLTNLDPLQSLLKLRTLAVDNNNISTILPIASLTNLTALSLSQNPITNIEYVALLTNLERASLRSLGITNADFLRTLIKAKDVELRENLITDMSFFTNMISLTRLDLRWNEITNAAPLSLGPVTLSSLYLGGNRISELPSLNRFTNLALLNLDHNRLIELTPLDGLSSLTYLSVGDNPLTNYSSLASLGELTGLEVAGSQLTNLSFVSGLHKLQFADFSWNKLTDLSPLLGLTNLQSLVLAGGKTINLSQLPQAPALKNLWLHNSGISNMTIVAAMPALNYLNLERNQISEAGALAALTNLTGLGLGYNPVTDFSALSSLEKLESLRLEGLCLETANIGFLANMPSLRFLDLNYNRIANIAPVSNMPALSSLYLRKNSLTDIAPLIGLNSLRFVDVRRNALDLEMTGVGSPSQILASLKCGIVSEMANVSELQPAAFFDLKPQNEAPKFTSGVIPQWFVACARSSSITLQVWDDSFVDEKLACPSVAVSAVSDNDSVVRVVAAVFSEVEQTVTVTITNENCLLAGNHASLQVDLTDDAGATTSESIRVELVGNTPILQSCPNTDSNFVDAISRQTGVPMGELTPADLLMLGTLTSIDATIVDSCVWQWLTNLTGLRLYRATLSSLDFVTNLPNLKLLSLMDTALPDTAVLSFLSNLEYVDLSGAGLTNLNALLPLPTTIKRLNLSRNYLRDISLLNRFSMLNELDLGENRLVNVSSISVLTGLAWVSLQQNWVTNINPLVALPALDFLDLRTNLMNLGPGSQGGQALFALTNDARPGGPVTVDFMTQRQPRFDLRTNWVVRPSVGSSVNFEIFDFHADEVAISAASTNFAVLSSVAVGPRTHTGGILSIAPVIGISNGTALVTLSATNDVPFVLSTNIVVIVTPWFEVGSVLNGLGLSWSSGGEKPWFGQNRISHDGIAAAQSGAVNDLQLSTLETTVVGPGTLSFWWKVSSETNYDFLTLTNNSVRMGEGISGEVEWQLMSVKALPGTNRLTWTYSRDKDTSQGLDAAFLDDVSFVPDPFIVAYGFSPVGQFQLGLQGVAGKSYRLEVSTNLVNWSILSTVTFTSQFAGFSDTNLVQGSRFYRLKDAAAGP